MALNVFLLLPNDDNLILEIIQDEQSYKNFMEFLSFVPKDNATNLFYDQNNIKTFLSVCDEFKSEKYLQNTELQLQQIISLKSADIQTNKKKSNECLYVLWNYGRLPNVDINPPETIAEIAERILSYPQETFLLLNVSEHIPACRNVLLVCKDAKHIPELPKFAHISFVTDKSDLELWLATNHITVFSLLDKTRFSKTNKIEQGQRVYKKTDTNCRWYLDNFHKNHYEVFDSQGNHIGEANFNGIIDESRRDNTKTITI